MAENEKKLSRSVDKALNRPWELVCEPVRVAPHIYYVGNTWVGAFLLDGGRDGLSIIDCTVAPAFYLVTESIRKLGFDPSNIKNVFLSHSHFDHDGAVQQLKALSGATVWLSKEDDEGFRHNDAILESYRLANLGYEPDRYYSWGEDITLGKLTIRPVLTPGHTPGTTSFFIDDIDESGRKLTWAMHGGVGENTMTPDYFRSTGLPESLIETFIEDCEKLKSIHVDICTPSHPGHSDMLSLINEDDRLDYTPFMDEGKWVSFLDQRKAIAIKSMGW